jgi:hypothetical protein
VKGLEGASHISHTLRISRGQRCGTLGAQRIDPDVVDLLLGLLGELIDRATSRSKSEKRGTIARDLSISPRSSFFSIRLGVETYQNEGAAAPERLPYL